MIVGEEKVGAWSSMGASAIDSEEGRVLGVMRGFDVYLIN